MARKTKPEPLTKYIGGRLYRAVIDGNKRIAAWEPVESAPEPEVEELDEGGDGE